MDRGLSNQFMHNLNSGILSPVLNMVNADDTLSLNIRSGYVNIYYRGGSILKITERPGGGYSFEFCEKYMAIDPRETGGLPLPSIQKYPLVITTDADSLVWVKDVPFLKMIMDLWFGQHPKLEREIQQQIERSNNCNPSTDYFVCDIEYTGSDYTELRADMMALHWPSTSQARKRNVCDRLAIIEVKHGEGAIAGKSGLIDHIQTLASSKVSLNALAEEMRIVFNQRSELGLIHCHSNSPTSHTVVMESKPKSSEIQGFECSRPEYIILLSDVDPASSILAREIGKIDESSLPFDVRIAEAYAMGYGLFDQGILSLEDFRAKYLSRKG